MTVLAVILVVAVVWAGTAVVLALLTGGMIHERDVHDRPARRRAVTL